MRSIQTTAFATDHRRAALASLARPHYSSVAAHVPALCFRSASGTQWYPPVMAGASTIADMLFRGDYIARALELAMRLSPDDYASYLKHFYSEGLTRFGTSWRYADIVTVLLCLAEVLRPRSYLEIGVRRGRTACAVASVAPDCTLVLFDMWIQDYAGMPNPGPDFVAAELKKVSHRGPVVFNNGNSCVTIPAFFERNPDLYFDLVTVDGDHSLEGAAADLAATLPRLAIGGAVVFDDIAHPQHPELGELWNDFVVRDPRFSTWSFTEAGYGVGFAIRHR